MVNIKDNLCIKQGNSSIFGPKIRGLSLGAVSNQEWVIMARIWYLELFLPPFILDPYEGSDSPSSIKSDLTLSIQSICHPEPSYQAHFYPNSRKYRFLSVKYMFYLTDLVSTYKCIFNSRIIHDP